MTFTDDELPHWKRQPSFLRPEHVCNGACAPGFHPNFVPDNKWGRLPMPDEGVL